MGALKDAWDKGLQELQNANAGRMAMDAPPIELPKAESPQTGYEAALQQIEQTPSTPMEQSRSIEI